MKKIFYYVISISIIFVLSLILIYNSNKNEDNKLTIAEVTHSVFYAPFYASIHNGYFEEEGLNVDVILTSGADKVASSVLSGDAQIGLSGLEATLYVYDNNAKDYLVSFSSLTKRDGQFLFGDCSLKDNFILNDLNGKSVLVGRKGGMPAMVFAYALYKNGITSGVTLDTSVDFASLSGAYISKVGDFVNLFEPTASALEKEGAGCVLDSVGKIAGELPYTVFHTKKSYLDNNEKTLKKFTNAIKKGLVFVKNNDSKTIAKAIQNEFPDTSLDDLEKVINRYKEADSWYGDTLIREEAYNNLLDLMKYNNALEKRYSFDILVDNRFNE